jgi:hypothetical protein
MLLFTIPSKPLKRHRPDRKATVNMDWRHFSDKTVKTQKTHECILCGREIPAFSQAVRRRGSMDGKPTSFMMHLDCELASQEWDDLDWITNDPCQFANEMEERRQVNQ